MSVRLGVCDASTLTVIVVSFGLETALVEYANGKSLDRTGATINHKISNTSTRNLIHKILSSLPSHHKPGLIQ